MCTPAGIDVLFRVLFRHAGRELATPLPEGFRISPERPAEATGQYDHIVIGPPGGPIHTTERHVCRLHMTARPLGRAWPAEVDGPMRTQARVNGGRHERRLLTRPQGENLATRGEAALAPCEEEALEPFTEHDREQVRTHLQRMLGKLNPQALGPGDAPRPKSDTH